MAERNAPSLPRGRHGLSREEVEASQRARMMLALADAMTEKGYAATSVADVLGRAGVSRETFYQQFASKLDCFLQTFDTAADLLLERVGAAVAPADGTAGRAESALSAYLDALTVQPAYARLFLVESYAAGPAAIERRAAVQGRMADALGDLLAVDGKGDRFACQAFVAAVSGMVTVPLVSGDQDTLRRLRRPLLDLLDRTFPSARKAR